MELGCIPNHASYGTVNIEEDRYAVKSSEFNREEILGLADELPARFYLV